MKEYYVDLACIQIFAESEDDAYKKVKTQIDEKKLEIEICNVEPVGM